MPIVGRFGSLAGLGSLILPGGAMESIATVSVGSGGASSVSFSDIPSGFQHLQMRFIYRNTSTNGSSRTTKLTFNSDTGANYAWHQLYGDGATAAASGQASATYIATGTTAISTDLASSFGVSVLDILDYASTTKNKTTRGLHGRDHNGSGLVLVDSGLWMSTSAITSVTLTPIGNNFAQHTTAALFGLRAP